MKKQELLDSLLTDCVNKCTLARVKLSISGEVILISDCVAEDNTVIAKKFIILCCNNTYNSYINSADLLIIPFGRIEDIEFLF